MWLPKAICLQLFRHEMRFPFSFARAKAGKSIPARIAMMAITTSNSINVNASFFRDIDHALSERIGTLSKCKALLPLDESRNDVSFGCLLNVTKTPPITLIVQR